MALDFSSLNKKGGSSYRSKLDLSSLGIKSKFSIDPDIISKKKKVDFKLSNIFSTPTYRNIQSVMMEPIKQESILNRSKQAKSVAKPKESVLLSSIKSIGSIYKSMGDIARESITENKPVDIGIKEKEIKAPRTKLSLSDINPITQVRSILEATPEQRKDIAAKIILDMPLEQEERARTKMTDLRGFGKREQGRTLTTIGSGILGTIEGTLGGAEWLGVDAAKPLADKAGEWRKVLEPEDMDFVDKLLSGVGSAITFFVPGFGIMKGTSMIAKVSPKIALWFGSSAATALEALTEAGAVYRELQASGKSKTESSRAATKDFWVNAVLVGVTNKIGMFGEQAGRVKRFLMTLSTEGVQEMGQQVTSNILTGKPWDEGVLESGAIGAIIGGGMGAGTPEGVNVPTNIIPESIGLSIEEEKELKEALEPKNVPAEDIKVQDVKIEKEEIQKFREMVKSKVPVVVSKQTGEVIGNKKIAVVSRVMGVRQVPTVTIDESIYTQQEIEDIVEGLIAKYTPTPIITQKITKPFSIADSIKPMETVERKTPQELVKEVKQPLKAIKETEEVLPKDEDKVKKLDKLAPKVEEGIPGKKGLIKVGMAESEAFIVIKKKEMTIVKEMIRKIQQSAKTKADKAAQIARLNNKFDLKMAKLKREGELKVVRVGMRERFKGIQKGIRETKVLTRKDIVQRLRQINTLIEESDLTAKDKAKFRLAPLQIAKIISKEDLIKKADEIFDRIQRLEAAEKFRTQYTKITELVKSTKVKNRISKFPASLQNSMQKLFNNLREYSKFNQEKAQEKLDSNLKELDGKIPTLEQSIENTFLAMKAGSGLITSKEANKLADDLELLIKEGRQLKDIETFNKWQKIQNDIESVEGALTFKEGKETFGPRELTLLEKVKSRLKILGVKVLTDWTGAMGLVDWHRHVDKKELAKLFKATPMNVKYAGLNGRYNRELNKVIRESYQERYDSKFKKLSKKMKETFEFGVWTEGFVSKQIIIDLVNEKVNLGKLKNKDGVIGELEMSRGELIKRWIELQDPTLTESFIEGNKYSEEIFTAIDNKMTEQDKTFAKEAMRMWQELYDKLNPAYKALYGINLPKNPFYSPIRREGFEVDIENQFGEFLGEQTHRTAVTSGSFNKRVGSILPIQSQDVFQSLDKHFGEMNYFIAWGEQVRRFNQVFSDKNVKDGIINTFGKSSGDKLLKRIDFQIKQFANKGHRNATSAELWVGRLRRSFIMGKIFFKPAIMFKQLVSRVNYLEILTVKELILGEAEFWSHPIKYSKILRAESDFMRERGNHYEKDINDTLKSEEYARYTKTKSFLELGALYVKIGDADATIFPATWAYRKKLLAENATLKKPLTMEEIVELYEDFADNTQQSANISTQSEFQQSGEFAKQFTVFRTQQHQNARKVVNVVQSVFQEGGTSKKNLKKIARTIIIYHSIQNMLFQFVATGAIQLVGGDDEEFIKDMARAGLLGSLNFFPMGYELIDSIIRAVMGMQVFNRGMSVTPLDAVAKDIYNLAREIDPTDIEDFEVMEFIDDMSRVGGDFGLPSEQALNVGRGTVDLLKGNFLRGTLEVAQWSQWSLKPLEEEKTKKTTGGWGSSSRRGTTRTSTATSRTKTRTSGWGK